MLRPRMGESLLWAPARQALRSLRAAAPHAAPHALLRAILSPIPAIIRACGPRGVLADYGAGHGLLPLAALHAGVVARALVFDPDARKAAVLAALAQRHVAIEAAHDEAGFWRSLAALAPAREVTVLLADVLYLLHPAARTGLLDNIAEIAPGARIVAVHADAAHPIKGPLVAAEEFLAVEAAGWTAGAGIFHAPAREIQSEFARAGYHTEAQAIPGYPAAHVILTARRAAHRVSHRAA